MRAIEFMKRFAKIPFLVILGVVIIGIVYVLITFPPIMAGMAAALSKEDIENLAAYFASQSGLKTKY